MTYQLTKSTAIIRNSDGASIPADPANTDYAIYLSWVEAGNTPDPVAVVPAPPVTSVSLFQARAALMSTPSATPGKTLFDLADAALKQAGGIPLAAWEYSTVVTRTDTLMIQMAAQFGLSDAQVDALFVTAAGVVA